MPKTRLNHLQELTPHSFQLTTISQVEYINDFDIISDFDVTRICDAHFANSYKSRCTSQCPLLTSVIKEDDIFFFMAVFLVFIRKN